MSNVGRTTEAPVPAERLGSLQAIVDIRPLYFLPQEPLVEEVLIPAFKAANKVDCMVGFFSSEVLASLAPGLATYIEQSNDSIRLVISPLLRPADIDAIEQGTRTPEDLASEILESFAITEDFLQQHTLKCLTYLLRVGRLEIKIALMKDALFHPKVWLFQSGGDVMAAHGSSNVTYAGIAKNIEQIAISKSWEDSNQRYITEKLGYQFRQLWENKDDSCIVLPLPKAIKEQLLKSYTSESPPTERDLQKLYQRASGLAEDWEPYELPSLPTTAFAIPDELYFEDGPFAHQGKAVNSWCEAGFRGVLEMATGSGKTITAMICARRLYEETKPLLIVVAAPYVPLVDQWCEEISPFGLRPINLPISGGARGRSQELSRIRRRFRNGSSNVEAVVVSHRTLCDSGFKTELEKFDCALLLIADEAHNMDQHMKVNQRGKERSYVPADLTESYDNTLK